MKKFKIVKNPSGIVPYLFAHNGKRYTIPPGGEIKVLIKKERGR